MRRDGHENVSQGKPAAIAAPIVHRTKAHASQACPTFQIETIYYASPIGLRSASDAWLPPMFDVSNIEQSALRLRA